MHQNGNADNKNAVNIQHEDKAAYAPNQSSWRHLQRALGSLQQNSADAFGETL